MYICYTFGFFQFEIQGGIFHSCCSFTVTYNLLKGRILVYFCTCIATYMYMYIACSPSEWESEEQVQGAREVPGEFSGWS